jgi:rod shape-determining protein MreC
MLWILQFFVHHRVTTSLFTVTLLCFWMISSKAPEQQTITRALVTTIFLPFQITVNQAARVRTLFAENTRLKEQVTSLSTRLAELREEKSENERLRSLLDLKKNFSFDLAPARVIGHDPSVISRSIIIDIGRNRNVVRYMPVVSTRGLVGRVIQTMPTISLVQLLSDPLNRTSVMTSRGRVAGVLETETGDSFFLRFPSHSDLVLGDTVITTGLGGIYPKGRSEERRVGKEC